MPREASKCLWPTLREALTAFVANEFGHQGSGHIKPLHWYVACRLVVEGGFHPDEITPRPPFRVDEHGGRSILIHDPALGGTGEKTVLGGLKTKDVDVVVDKPGIGPAIAVSMKGTLKAFRNLTNRMEEAVGDCTNLHISYPNLVYGFFQILRGNVQSPTCDTADTAILSSREIAEPIRRYHDVLARLAGRNDVRDVSTKYEAVALAMISADGDSIGKFVDGFPDSASPLQFSMFFESLYRHYDLRFVYAAPKLENRTRRLEWDSSSPALADTRSREVNARTRC